MEGVVAMLLGACIGMIYGLRRMVNKSSKSKIFVCGHCESKDTLKVNKLRDRDIFSCSFCERIIDENLLKLMYKEDYEMLKNNPQRYEEFKRDRMEK